MSKKIRRAYKYRFYPTDEQRIILVQTFGCVRFVYNWGLSTRKTAYVQHGQSLSYNALAALLPDLKKQYPWQKLFKMSDGVSLSVNWNTRASGTDEP